MVDGVGCWTTLAFRSAETPPLEMFSRMIESFREEFGEAPQLSSSVVITAVVKQLVSPDER